MTNEALESIQQRPMIPELDAPPNTAEVDAAIKQLQTGKAPGPDGIPAEVFKASDETLITHLTRMFQVFWVNGQLPRDLRDANIIHLIIPFMIISLSLCMCACCCGRTMRSLECSC